jgi:hypothetical protein
LTFFGQKKSTAKNTHKYGIKIPFFLFSMRISKVHRKYFFFLFFLKNWKKQDPPPSELKKKSPLHKKKHGYGVKNIKKTWKDLHELS